MPRRGKSAWAFNQAIMELGALICTARVADAGNVRCGRHARQEGKRLSYPSIAPANSATSPNVPEIDATIRCRWRSSSK